MESREKFIQKRLRNGNLQMYDTLYDVGHEDWQTIFEKAQKFIKDKYGAKYSNRLKLSNIVLDSDMDSYVVSINIIMEEDNEDRDIRIQKERLTLDGLYSQCLQDEKDKKNARIQSEKQEYLRLKKKYE